jgi:hypothetical protein
MDLVLFVGVGVGAAFATWELVRRAVLGNRMDRSFEVLKVRTRQPAPGDDVVVHRAPLRRAVLIKAVRHHQRQVPSCKESPAGLISAGAPYIPLRSRRAS